MTHERGDYEAIAYRIRKTGREYVLEKINPYGSWVLIEVLPSLEDAECAYYAYTRDGHTVKWFV